MYFMLTPENLVGFDQVDKIGEFGHESSGFEICHRW